MTTFISAKTISHKKTNEHLRMSVKSDVIEQCASVSCRYSVYYSCHLLKNVIALPLFSNK